jgi:hypothetical protein
MHRLKGDVTMRYAKRVRRPLSLKSDVSLSAANLEMAARVECYDMSFVTHKLVDEGKLGREDTDPATMEFKKFIFLTGMGIKPLAMISPVVDEIWHQFILFTSHYRRFCEATVCTFIGHQPDTPLTPIPLTAGQNFLKGYCTFFGELPPVWFKGMNRRTVEYYRSRSPKGRPPTRWSGWTGSD